MTTKPPTIGPSLLSELVGEGVHVGLRKGTDADGSHAAWKAIVADDSGWEEALNYFLWGLSEMYPDGFVYDPKKKEPT